MAANEKKVNANFLERFARNNSSEFTLLLVLIAFIILSAILSPHFLTASNLANIGTSMSYIGVIAAGLTVVMLMGGIDLSQMSAMAISVMIVGIMVKQGSNPLLVILCAILVGAASGLLNSFIIVGMRVMPMIATIGTQMIYRALAYITTNGKCYARNGGDYIAQLAEMAGGDYICADMNPDKGGNTSMTFEEWYNLFVDADYLFYYNLGEKFYTVEDMIAYNPLFADFKAVQNGNVWITCEGFSQKSADIVGVITDMHTVLSSDDNTVTTDYIVKIS